MARAASAFSSALMVALGKGGLGLRDGRDGLLHIDDGVVGQPELVGAERARESFGGKPGGDEKRTDLAYHAPQGRLPRRRQLAGPQRLGQLLVMDGTGTLTRE